MAENVYPIFIIHHKDVEERRNTIYNNQLQDGRSLRWYARTSRRLPSDEIQRLLVGVKEGKLQVKLHLFVKQSDAVGKEFYYLGPAYIQLDSVGEELVGPKKRAAVGMNLVLEHPLTLTMMNLLAM